MVSLESLSLVNFVVITVELAYVGVIDSVVAVVGFERLSLVDFVVVAVELADVGVIVITMTVVVITVPLVSPSGHRVVHPRNL